MIRYWMVHMVVSSSHFIVFHGHILWIFHGIRYVHDFHYIGSRQCATWLEMVQGFPHGGSTLSTFRFMIFRTILFFLTQLQDFS